MKFRFDSVWIADDNFRAFDVQVQGRQVVEEQQFLRALNASFAGRKNRSISVGFSVNRPFGTIREAENFVFAHHSTLQDQADLLARIGLLSETPQDVTLGDAVLEDVSFRYLGTNVTVRYQFRAGAVSGIITTPTEDVFTSGTAAIGNGASSVNVSGLGLGSIPTQVLVTVRKPAGGFNLVATVDDSTISTAGFTAYLSGSTNSANYKLDYLLLF